MKTASGQCCRVASSRFRVPTALTPKSVCGSRAAQSCDGCAAVWTTTLMAVPNLAKSLVHRVGVADVHGFVPVILERVFQLRACSRWRPPRRKITHACRCPCRRCQSLRRKRLQVSEPMSPAEPVTRAMLINIDVFQIKMTTGRLKNHDATRLIRWQRNPGVAGGWMPRRLQTCGRQDQSLESGGFFLNDSILRQPARTPRVSAGSKLQRTAVACTLPGFPRPPDDFFRN